MHIDLLYKHVLTARGASTRMAGLQDLQNGLHPSIQYKKSRVLYKIIENLMHMHLPQSQHTRFLGKDTAIKMSSDSVDTVAQRVLDRTNTIDESLPYLASAMFNDHTTCRKIASPILLKKYLEDWPEATKCNVEEGTPPLIFYQIP